MKRGEIWWADLPSPQGSGPGYRRPILIISSDAFNMSRINTVIAVVISSNLRLAMAPGNVLLPVKETSLSKKSVANISQIITIDKSFLTEKVGSLSARLLKQVETGIKLVLEI